MDNLSGSCSVVECGCTLQKSPGAGGLFTAFDYSNLKATEAANKTNPAVPIIESTLPVYLTFPYNIAKTGNAKVLPTPIPMPEEIRFLVDTTGAAKNGKDTVKLVLGAGADWYRCGNKEQPDYTGTFGLPVQTGTMPDVVITFDGYDENCAVMWFCNLCCMPVSVCSFKVTVLEDAEYVYSERLRASRVKQYLVNHAFDNQLSGEYKFTGIANDQIANKNIMHVGLGTTVWHGGSATVWEVPAGGKFYLDILPDGYINGFQYGKN